MKLLLLATWVVALTSFTFSASAEKYFKWVDKQGVTHYSETAPIDVSTTLIKVVAESSNMPNEQTDGTNAESLVEGNGDTSAMGAVALQNPDNPELKQQQTAIRQANCAMAKDNLIALENTSRVRQLDKNNGEYRYLPDEEKLAEMSKMRKYLNANCRA